MRVGRNGIYERQHIRADRQTDPLLHRTYHASRRKRARGALLIVGAIASGAYLVWRDPYVDTGNMAQMATLALIFGLLFAIAAVGIERLFEPLPTLAAGPGGLVLFPRSNSAEPVAWADIECIEVYRFAPKAVSSGFLSIKVADPDVIARHLAPHLRVAWRIDRWAVGANRYFRPASDFDRPVAEIAAELEAMRIAAAKDATGA